MVNLIFGILLIIVMLWTAKKFYFPMEAAQHPERYPAPPAERVSQKELAMVLTHLQRWRKEGKITREEYDHLTDICLAEMRPHENDFPETRRGGPHV